MSNTERSNERFDLGEGIARQELNVIFVIDNSGSMQGEKIGAVKADNFQAVDYVEEFAYESTKQLFDEGYIKATKEKKVELDF